MRVRTPSYQAGFYAPERGGRAAYPQLWRGCVGAWNPGLGPSGAVLRDWGGRKNHSTLTNGPVWSTSTGQQAIQFDGVNDHISVGLIGIGAVNTRSLWFRSSNTSRNGYMMDMGGNNYWIQHNLNRVTVGAGNTSYFASNQTISNDRWYHASAVMDAGSRLALYIDGILDKSQIVTPGTPGILSIGRFSLNSSFNFFGDMTDIVIHNRALSANEISLLARRPGIAYELAARRFYSLPPSSARLRRLLTGAT